MLRFAPAVFAVGRNYHIMAPVSGNSLFWVRVGDQCYYDGSNGVMRSGCSVHRAVVPMSALDAAGEYTVCERPVLERKPYFPATGDVEETCFRFRPVRPGRVRAFHVADTHNVAGPAIAAAKAFGEMDFLVLNGDLPNHSGDTAYFDTIYELAEGITGGGFPIVYARGNHDLRGQFAEAITDYTPSEAGNTYYTFRLGDIWGVVLDCGEDKWDSHPEYYHTVCCQAFRRQETAFLRDLVARAGEEYLAEGVRHRIVICHIPFTAKKEPEFDIERELYAEWARLLKENVRPEVMLSGHDHLLSFQLPGCETDDLGHPCPVVVGAQPKGADGYAGAGFEFAPEGITVTFSNTEGELLEKHEIACC